MPTPDRRPSPAVYGIETEYSCMVTLPGGVVHEIVGSCHSVDAKLGLYSQPAQNGTSQVPAGKLTNAIIASGLFVTKSGMLSNGGRLYIDPSGPEYDTPETSTAEDTVHRSFDGDKIVVGVFEHMRRDKAIESYQVNRRIVDHNRTSRGVHLNTTTSLAAAEPSSLVKCQLATLNVARGAIFGSGGLLIDDRGDTAFHHSPRLSVTTDLSMDFQQHTRRPLVRYPFKSDGQSLARIETVTSDALNFAWPMRASLVITNAVVGAIEMGRGNDIPILRDPVSAARNVGRNGNANRIAVIDDYDSYVGVRPLDIMRGICETVLEIDEVEEQLDEESRQVIPEIIDVADRMTADLYSVAGQVESVGRFVAMRKKMEKDGLKLDSETMCRFDYAWDWLNGGIAEGLRERNLAGWQGFDANHDARATTKRIISPPQDTRAKIRGEAIGKSRGNNSSDWDRIDTGQGTIYVHPLITPKPGSQPPIWTTLYRPSS